MLGVVVVDMVHDFVDGRFGSERARRCVDTIGKLLEFAHRKKWTVVFTRDVHLPGDEEFRVWGEHCLRGSKASELVFTPANGDFVIEKMRYDAFYQSPLDMILKCEGVEKVILVGVSTDICVQHTASGAFFRGYEIAICSDCTESIDDESKNRALEYMHRVYGAEIIGLKEVLEW
jgi:nicotinamidase-related amidase